MPRRPARSGTFAAGSWTITQLEPIAVSRTPAPTLDDLAQSDRPGWLWDFDQLRIAWSNPAGIAYWGADSLFDLLDRRFDRAEAGVGEIARIGASIGLSDSARATLRFVSSGSNVPLECTCWPHRLADGRAGLLVAADAPARSRGGGGREIAAEIFDQIPFALAVFDGDGTFLLRNSAAVQAFGAPDSGEEAGFEARTLTDIVQDDKRARSLIERSLKAGLVSETVTVATTIGERVHRISASRLGEADTDGEEAALLVIFDDITERRRHERSLTENARRLEDLVAAVADFTFELDGALTVRALSAGFEAATGARAEAVIGRPWLDLGRDLDPETAKSLAAALDANEPFRVTLRWADGPASPYLSWSAVPIINPEGGFAGYRGIAARARDAGQDRRGTTQKGVESDDVGTRQAATGASDRDLDLEDQRAFEAIARALSAVAGDDRAATKPPAARVKEADGDGEPDPRAVAEESVHRRHLGLLDRLPAGIIVHRDFDILYANSAAATALGYEGRDGLVNAGSLLNVFPGEEAVLESAVKAAASGSEQAGARVVLARTPTVDGPQQPYAVTASFAPVEWPGGEAQQVLLAEATQEAVPAPRSDEGAADELRAILNIATDGIIVLDAKGRIESANQGAAAILGREPADLSGEMFARLLTKSSGQTFRAYLKSVAAAGIESLLNDGRELTAIEKRGGELPMFVSLGRIDDGAAGTKPRYCAVIRDQTQWKDTEIELRRAKEEAEAVSAQKSAFIARISHELRTPLNAIIGFAEVMATEKFGALENPKYKAYVKDIHASGEHVLSLINDLLDLSKMEAGSLDLNFAAVDLGEVVQGCVNLMQPDANRARVIIRSSLGENLPAVMADRRSIRQIVLNLVSNAVKFTDPGGQAIVSVFRDEDGALKIRVRDTGIGMNEDELHRAMEPFQQINRPERESAKGTGLGLPLTKALVEANRAGFEIESMPGEGTTVQVTFPAARVLTD